MTQLFSILAGSFTIVEIVGDEVWVAISLKKSLMAGLATSLAGMLAVACSELSQLSNEVQFEAQVADHLTLTGAKMYGAYWCPYSAQQKRLFGLAAGQLPYVECDRTGLNTQAPLCTSKGIKVFPTWEIEGKLYPGVKPPGQLAQLSGFIAPSGPPPTPALPDS